MDNNYIKFFLLFVLVSTVIGCSGSKTFHEVARAGDTVAVPAGQKNNFQRSNITVTITDSVGGITVYSPGHPAVRASINLYLDPLSSMIVSDRTGVSQTPNALTYIDQNKYHNMVPIFDNKGEYDWWESVVFVDLPEIMESTGLAMATGDATITIQSPPGPDQETISSTVSIVSGTGVAHNFGALTKGNFPFAMEDQHMQALERVNHSVVNFTGTTLPYAIQIDLTHDADKDNGGDDNAEAYVSNPTGHIKSVLWSDDGFNTRIILMPNRDSDITDIMDFKIYLAGITGWSVLDTTPADPVGNVQAFNINGETINGVIASID